MRDHARDLASLIFNVLNKEEEPDTLNILLHTIRVDYKWVLI